MDTRVKRDSSLLDLWGLPVPDGTLDVTDRLWQLGFYALASDVGTDPILDDTFTDTNGTEVDAHTADTGQSWLPWFTGGQTDAVISSNGVITQNATARYISTADHGTADVELIADLTLSGGNTFALLARTAQNSAERVSAFIDSDEVISLVERDASDLPVGADQSVDLPPMTTLQLRLVVQGSTAYLYYTADGGTETLGLTKPLAQVLSEGSSGFAMFGTAGTVRLERMRAHPVAADHADIGWISRPRRPHWKSNRRRLHLRATP